MVVPGGLKMFYCWSFYFISPQYLRGLLAELRKILPYDQEYGELLDLIFQIKNLVQKFEGLPKKNLR